MPALEAVDPARLRALLGPGTRWRVEVIPETGSTNDDLVARAGRGEPAGLALIAEHQTGGHGRFARSWDDVPGAGLALSVLLRPARPVAQWGWLSLVAGLAVTTALRRCGGGAAARVGLKWPNDVLVDGRKACGLLAVARPPAAVLGLGLNVGQDRAELPVPTATSLALAGLATDKTVLAGTILAELEAALSGWEAGADPRPAYLAVSATIGARVRVDLGPAGAVEGEAVGLDEWGGLAVRGGDGAVSCFAAGDVVHLR